MKTIFKKLSILSLFIALTISCSNDDNKEQIANCETNNFGVLTVNFGSTETKHGILVTNSGSSQSRDKIVPAGKSQDTIHLKTGTYNIEISSLNDQNQALDSQMLQNYSISKCDEKSTNVNF